MDLSSPLAPNRRERWIVASVIAGLALLLALIETSRNYLVNVIINRPIPALTIFVGTVPAWLLTAALTPLPLIMARRVPIGRSRRVRALSLHGAGAIAFSGLHTLGMAAFVAVQRSSFVDFWSLLPKTGSQIAVNMMLYAAIVGAVHALRFSREARARELTASQLQTSLSEARLAALRSQLNPHFLFNTLNAISTMALKGEQDNVVRTLGCLGEMLRVSLDDKVPQEVTLADELEFLEHYLEIQRTRFGDRLTIVREVDAPLLSAMVPSMILQPLVENAVTHGIARVPGPGEILIRATRNGARLMLEITNTGPGVADNAAFGIGLANCRARLEQLYGSRQGVTLSSTDRGAMASVQIPYRECPLLREGVEPA
jgi:two-component system LytT family sensor kinase